VPQLDIPVENATDLLATSNLGAGALLRVERSATETGAYVEITTIALVAGQRMYRYYDLAGTVSSWYRTRYSKSDGSSLQPYGSVWQTGDETAGLLCSLYDAQQRIAGSATMSDNDRETLLDVIRGVSSEIEDYTGAWWASRPTDPESSTTYRFDVDRYATSLWLRQGSRYTGVRSVTAINLATTSQPATGGTYTAGTVADVFIRPQPSEGNPGWRIELSDYPSGSNRFFYPGYNTVEVTGTFGPASVPYWMQEIAIAAVTRRFLGKETAATAIGLGPEGGVRLLAGLPSDMAQRLEAHRFMPVA